MSNTFTSNSNWQGDVYLNGSSKKMQVADNNNLYVGSADDFGIVHDGTNTTFTSGTGDLIIDNTNTTGSTIFKLGSNDANTDFQIQKDNGTVIFSLDGIGDMTCTNLTVSSSLTVGGELDVNNTERLLIDGNKTDSASADGFAIHMDTATFTDSSTAQDGTATHAHSAVFEAYTLASSNTGVTTTNSATVYIKDAPTAGTNMTLTNKYALWVDGGDVKIDDGFILPIYDTTGRDAITSLTEGMIIYNTQTDELNTYDGSSWNAVSGGGGSSSGSANAIQISAGSGSFTNVSGFTHNGTTLAVGSNYSIVQSSGNTTVGGTIGITGATTLDSTLNVSGATQLSNTLTIGVDDTGYDVKFFGATTNKYMLWDESVDRLIVHGTLYNGSDSNGNDVKFFGASASRSMLWDASADTLIVDGSITSQTGTLTASTVDINGGNVDGTAIGSASASSGAFTTISASSTLDITGAVVMDSTLNVSGAIDANSTANFAGLVTCESTLDVTGAVVMDSTLGVTGNVDLNANLIFNTSQKGIQLDCASAAATKYLYHDFTNIGTGQNVEWRLFRTTDTTGECDFYIFKGNNTTTTNCKLSAKGDSYLNTDAGNVGVGNGSPECKLHIYENTSTGGAETGLTIEQDGVGDAVCHFELTGGEIWSMGIDNSDGDAFRITNNVNLSSANTFKIDTSGNVAIGTGTAGSRMHIYENTSATGATAGLTIEQDGVGDAVCHFELTGGEIWSMGIDNSTGTDDFVISNSADLGTTPLLRINTQFGNTYFNATINPEVDNSYDLGSTGLRWDDVYATNGTIQTSDRRLKEDITYIDNNDCLSLVNDLQPATYKWIAKKEDKPDYVHFGLIAQDVEEALIAHNLVPDDMGCIRKNVIDEETGENRYSLQYTEFIPYLIGSVKALSAEVAELRAQLANI